MSEDFSHLRNGTLLGTAVSIESSVSGVTLNEQADDFLRATFKNNSQIRIITSTSVIDPIKSEFS